MNVQPKPAILMPAPKGDPTRAPHGAEARPRVPVAGPRLQWTWPVEFEVEPWRP